MGIYAPGGVHSRTSDMTRTQHHQEAPRRARYRAGSGAGQEHVVEHFPQRLHWGAIAATDLFTVEVVNPFGLVRYHVLFVIDIATRCVCIGGMTSDPNGEWMKQAARNLTDMWDGFLLGKRYLIHDRDPLFTEGGDVGS